MGLHGPSASQIQDICEVTLIGLPYAVQQKRIQLPLYLVGFKRIYKRPTQMKKNTPRVVYPHWPSFLSAHRKL
jgi:hypothetical protein